MFFYIRALFVFCLPILVMSCASSDKEFDREAVKDTTEFEEVVKIETLEEAPILKKNETSKQAAPKKTKKSVKTNPPKKSKDTKKDSQAKSPVTEDKKVVEKEKVIEEVAKSPQVKGPRLPKLEDSEGFNGRRPITPPYHVGEEIVLGISFFAMEAGKFTMKVKPMVQVNGAKSYHFQYIIKTSPLFSMFYSVDDVAETFVDYETLLPYSYEIHVNESKQVRETRTFFDHKKKKATMWDRKQPKNKEIEKKKIEWPLLAYSQNVFSVPYYLRTFTLKVGKELKVRVGHEGKNIVMTAKVLRKETLFTDAGKFETFVVRPKFDVDGKFKPTGENYLWLTADDRKHIVRLESKIKIGSIVGEVQKLKK